MWRRSSGIWSLRTKPQENAFELSEAQNLSRKGIENLNYLHDELGVGLLLANFGTGHSNIDLLREVHFDGVELDRLLCRPCTRGRPDLPVDCSHPTLCRRPGPYRVRQGH